MSESAIENLARWTEMFEKSMEQAESEVETSSKLETEELPSVMDDGFLPLVGREWVEGRHDFTLVMSTDVFGDVIDLPHIPLELPQGTDDMPSNWADYVPSIDDVDLVGYKPNGSVLFSVLYAINQKVPSFLHGPAGTGKTSAVKWVCAKLGIPFFRINGRDDVEPAQLLGWLGMNSEGDVYREGILPELFRSPLVLLIDEISAYPNETLMGVFQSPLETGGKLYLQDKPEDRIVEPNPLFRFFASDNTKGQGDSSGRYSGTNVLNNALLDRFGQYVEFSYLTEDEEVSVLREKVPALPEHLAKKMIRVAKLVRNGAQQEEFSHSMSIRPLVHWANLSLVTKDTKSAFEVTFARRFDEAEFLAVMGIYRDIFGE